VSCAPRRRLRWKASAWNASQRNRRSMVRRATCRTRAAWRCPTQEVNSLRHAAFRCGFFCLESARNDWRENPRRQTRQRNRGTGCARPSGWYEPSRVKNPSKGRTCASQRTLGQRGGMNTGILLSMHRRRGNDVPAAASFNAEQFVFAVRSFRPAPFRPAGHTSASDHPTASSSGIFLSHRSQRAVC